LADVLGLATGGTLSYTVSAGGYAGQGSNGCSASYHVAGYAGHNYGAYNHGSFGAGTIQNGYKSSNNTEYDSRGVAYHPCKNLGAYIANGEIYAYVPSAQKYGFTVSNNSSIGLTLLITITGSYG